MFNLENMWIFFTIFSKDKIVENGEVSLHLLQNITFKYVFKHTNLIYVKIIIICIVLIRN